MKNRVWIWGLAVTLAILIASVSFYKIGYRLSYAREPGPILEVVDSAGASLVGESQPAAPAGPYRLDFVATYNSGRVWIDPHSIHVLGKNEKDYAGFTYAKSVAPTVAISVGGKQTSLEPMKFA